MATLIGKIFSGYTYVFDELGDKRTKLWTLAGMPHKGMILLALYLLFVTKWGPKLMEKRKPFNLERVLIVYNAIQVLCCGYMFIISTRIWIKNYQWICEPVDYSNSEISMQIASLVYYYYMLKIMDLFDTVFFVLRKKFNQITFLHVYHHTGMVMLSWGAVTYFPGGHATMVGVVNSFVHTVMYSYYLLTVAYPSIKKSLWWKKYITQLQIIQFFHNVIHMGSLVFVPTCRFPRWIAALFLPQNIFMLILFLDFYFKAYVTKPKVKGQEKKDLEMLEDKKENTDVQRLIQECLAKDNFNVRS